MNLLYTYRIPTSYLPRVVYQAVDFITINLPNLPNLPKYYIHAPAPARALLFIISRFGRFGRFVSFISITYYLCSMSVWSRFAVFSTLVIYQKKVGSFLAIGLPRVRSSRFFRVFCVAIVAGIPCHGEYYE